MEIVAKEQHGGTPIVREASPVEVFNIPLYEIPPMLDVRSGDEFCESHIFCAVSAPLEDGFDLERLCMRILDHDNNYGWCLQHPFVVVYSSATLDRAKWLADVLCGIVQTRGRVDGFEGTHRAEELLERLSFQCRQIFFVHHQEFSEAFSFCCTSGAQFGAPTLDRLGPLPRCALLHPKIFLAGRQVQLSEDLLRTLGATHVVVNADAWDIMDGTSGGNASKPFLDRHADVQGICYLKCDIPDRREDPDHPHVLDGAVHFLQQCAEQGGTAVVFLHGQSCSSTVICAFLMASRNLSVDEAWHEFQKARIQTDSNLVWWDALNMLAQRSRKRAIEDELPDETGNVLHNRILSR